MNIRQSKIEHRHSHKRGSVLILVVAVLMLMVLVGTAYIQAARLDRLSTAQLNKTHVDQVESGELARIMYFLKADLIDPDTGDFLDNGDSGDGTVKHTREPFDYPHKDVDPWLATYTPDSSVKWLNLTDLTEGDTSLLVSSGAKFEDSDNGGITAVAYDGTSPIDSGDGLFDADGDGISDSVFIKAAIEQVGGNVYVAAIRIVDLSALLNINVATAVRNDDGSPVYVSSLNDSPRGRYPSELDMSYMLRSSESKIGRAKFRSMLGYKFGVATITPPIPWGSGDSRDVFWENGARLWGNFNNGGATTLQPLGANTELIFRRKNGLNTPDSISSPLQDDNLILAGLRDKLPTSGGTEAPTTNDPTNDQEIAFDDTGDGATIAEFFNTGTTLNSTIPEVRKFLTTMSATATFAPDLGGGSGARMQLDLNRATVAEISGRIKDIYANNPPSTFPPGIADENELADQLAANIKDYLDADNKLTTTDASSGSARWGLEALPFVAEAYVQHNYQVTAAVAKGTMPETWDATWERKGSSVVIEVRNPFKRKISVENVTLELGSAKVDLIDAGVTELDEGKFIIIYHNTGDAGDLGDPLTALGLDGHADLAGSPIDLGSNPFDNASTSREDAIMVVKDDQDADVKYQQARIQNVSNPDEPENAPVEYTIAPTEEDPTDKWGYRHRTMLSNANGINAMVMRRADNVVSIVNYTNDRQPEAHNAGIIGLGVKDKTTYGGPADLIDPTTAQLVLRDAPDDQMWQVGELAHILIIGPGAGSPPYIADAWDQETDVTKFMLDFDSADLYDTNPGPFNLPHAMVLFDQFTTLGPNVDTVDNDGDEVVDNVEETKVPGRINLNTAPNTVLYRALPLGLSDSNMETLINDIISYRDDDPTTRTGTYRNTATDVGIATIAELHRVTGVTGASSLLTDTSGEGYTSDSGVNLRIDYMPEPTAVSGGTADNDGVVGDREETFRLLRWINQMCTTRSDVFAAYVVIRGYAGGEFTDGGDPAAPDEQVRFVAILDRSEVLTTDGEVKVLALLRY